MVTPPPEAPLIVEHRVLTDSIIIIQETFIVTLHGGRRVRACGPIGRVRPITEAACVKRRHAARAHLLIVLQARDPLPAEFHGGVHA